MTINITFGALAEPLHSQLSLPRRRLRYLQECADGVTALSVGRLLSESEVHRARQRIMKRIMQTFGRDLQKRVEAPKGKGYAEARQSRRGA